jgi:uncharacterized protein (TIGR03083 family)
MTGGHRVNAAIEGVRVDRDALLDICAGLTAADWAAPAGCAGWTVKDLVAHLATLFWAVVDLSRLPDISARPLELGVETWVQTRRELDAAAVLDDYRQVSEIGLRRLDQIAALDIELPMGQDAGTYPAAVFVAAYSFDHFTHIRSDLFQPRGPLTGNPPPADDFRIGSVLDWIEAALPQQNPQAAEAGLYELQVTGPAARIITFGTGQAMTTVTSDAMSFVHWVTQRGSWEELGVQATGDEPALSLARKLKVF